MALDRCRRFEVEVFETRSTSRPLASNFAVKISYHFISIGFSNHLGAGHFLSNSREGECSAWKRIESFTGRKSESRWTYPPLDSLWQNHYTLSEYTTPIYSCWRHEFRRDVITKFSFSFISILYTPSRPLGFIFSKSYCFVLFPVGFIFGNSHETENVSNTLISK